MGALKVFDNSFIPYLCTKLKARIDDYQNDRKKELDQFQKDTKAELDKYQSDVKSSIDDAIKSANAAADNANDSVKNVDELYNGVDSKFVTKDDLSDAIGGIISFDATVVQSLPSTGVTGTVYLMAASDGSGNDIYDEYLWLKDSSRFEKIGTTRIDLTPYLKSADAASTYLTKNDATTKYLTKEDADITYLNKSAADLPAAQIANALTISLNGVSQGAYDGTTPKYIDITPSSIGAAETSHGTHVTYSTDSPKANGTANAGSSAALSRSDHVHPLQTTVSGNAGSASKVNNSLTISLNGTSQGGFDGSAAKSIDITPSSIGAATTSHGTHVSYSTTAPSANGTASAGSATTVSRSDHVHPLQTTVSGSSGSCTGNAATATTASKVANALTILLNGVTQGAFDGSSSKSIDITPSSIGAATSDHTHPLQTSVSGSSGSCTGNAATASKLATARTIAISGAMTGSASFDGSAGVNINLTANAGTEVPDTLTEGSVYFVYEDDTTEESTSE